jgi:hypothetical protein
MSVFGEAYECQELISEKAGADIRRVAIRGWIVGNNISCEREMGRMQLADIIDVPALQSLMDDFYGLTRVPMSLLDLNGTVLAGAGWQKICTKFHRNIPKPSDIASKAIPNSQPA